MAKANGMIHHARLDTSPRLKKLLSCLHDGQWHSTAELTHRCHNYAVGTFISELRANGKRVESRRVKMASGERWHEYRLEKEVMTVRSNPCQGCDAYYTRDHETKICALDADRSCTWRHPTEVTS